MAEAANVRQNLQNVPSIFEISASETLDNLIYPALSKIFDYFGLRLDFKLWGSLRIQEELSPLLTWLLQYLYLRKRSSPWHMAAARVLHSNRRTPGTDSIL